MTTPVTITLPTPGGDTGTWGPKLNTALQSLADAYNALITLGGVGVTTVAGRSGDVVLKAADLSDLSTIATAAALASETAARIAADTNALSNAASQSKSADTVTDGTTHKSFLATERTKLTGVATGATANQADAYLLSRSNHSGTQAASTITGQLTVEQMAPGTTITVLKAGGVWPARPTARADIIVQWKGPDPSPAIITSAGTGGELSGVDIRLTTAS